MDLAAMCLSFLLFLNETGQYERVETCPDIELLSLTGLQQLACDGASCPAKAYYDRKNETIYLSDQLDLKNPINRSILLHELVHYVQDVTDSWDTEENHCRSGMKRELYAFRIQEMFLLENNIHFPVSHNMAFYRC